ncbi:substrate-binding domain-containing protein [Streptomyces indiaensis]|uniref:substrate-binding domain-containing protein n=2 Tax=Streptomyces indiaensis TaxID=284033 RepID=UPI0035579659
MRLTPPSPHAAARSRPRPHGDWSAASVQAAGRELAALGDCTAVFAAADAMAIGVVRALTEAGPRVPDDISVVGFADIPVAAYVTPPPTTVRPPFDAAAQEGIRLLVRAVEQPEAELPPPHDPPVALSVRASTAPRPGAPAGRRPPLWCRRTGRHPARAGSSGP